MTDHSQRWSREDVAVYWRYAAAHRGERPRAERQWREQCVVPLADFVATKTSGSATPGEDVWKTVLLLVGTAPDDEALCWLGAGPIEDLAVYHGDAFVDRFVVSARRDERFRSALRCAWLDGASQPVRDALAVFRVEPLP